ncbi:MAG: 4-hydroxy-tetrahydrodipicolinate reductase [Clostridia bacterium]|nr:4-hydroxy-tetrahydrodipicolinate reductase [Clostridia bacterium]
MNILVNGILGHMGKIVADLCRQGYRDSSLVGGIDISPATIDVPLAVGYTEADNLSSLSQVDVIVDFSHHSSTEGLLDFATRHNIPVVLATTGHSEEEKVLINRAGEMIPIFYSANMSVGVAILVELAKRASVAMPDAEIEIVEKHHNRKVDAPSGTALMIARGIQEVRPNATLNLGRSGNAKRTHDEIGIHAIRMGNIVGEHEVIIGTNAQTITLKHEAHDRSLFAEGAICAAQFIVGKSAGVYNMQDLLAD